MEEGLNQFIQDVADFEGVIKENYSLFEGTSESPKVTALSLIEKLQLVLLGFDEISSVFTKQKKYRLRQAILAMIWVLEDYLKDDKHSDLKNYFNIYYKKFINNIDLENQT